jgi:predicted dehydrogenase
MKRFAFLICGLLLACTTDKTDSNYTVSIMTLNPGHFHAALVQKTMYEQVNPKVHVFAPEGSDLQLHLKRIEGFNTRQDNPTKWDLDIYTGDDYFQRMLRDKAGNLVVISGNNRKKTDYIMESVNAGLNVLADKPMVIDREGFELLKKAFATAEENNVLLYDIMTERYEITSILQKELSQIPEIFGTLQTGTPDDPAVTKESVHYFFKYVSGSPLQRPDWFFDVTQQGEGMVDVSTHLVDLIQWGCYPEQILDYTTDVQMVSARRWPTSLTRSQFQRITNKDMFPEFLKSITENDSVINVFSNGEMVYKLKNTYAKVSVTWGYQAPEGAGDTHYSIMKGSRSNLIIKQGEEQNFRPELYIEPSGTISFVELVELVDKNSESLKTKFPGLEFIVLDNSIQLMIPNEYRIGHEAHFAKVAEKFLTYFAEGKLPDWEVPNMLTKYYTTTLALEKAKENIQ